MLEPIETLNYRLSRDYGYFDGGLQPNWRLVWSQDQFEKRLTKYNDKGEELAQSEFRELPKYRQWIQNKWVLERLFPVPHINGQELTTKTSYEPVWVFEDDAGNYLPPKWEAIQFIIQQVHRQAGEYVGAKYKEELPLPEEAREARIKELEKLEKELFGNETSVGDALAYKEGVSLTGNKFGEN